VETYDEDNEKRVEREIKEKRRPGYEQLAELTKELGKLAREQADAENQLHSIRSLWNRGELRELIDKDEKEKDSIERRIDRIHDQLRRDLDPQVIKDRAKELTREEHPDLAQRLEKLEEINLKQIKLLAEQQN
jgi:hypothetical protein